MFSKILLPSDFSECSAEAARAARRLADHFGSRVTVLHVLDEPAAFDPMFRGEVPVELLRGRMEQYAIEEMERFVDAHFRGHPGVLTLTASDGNQFAAYEARGDGSGKAAGMIGWMPEKAVTFIDNHDTGSTQALWPFPSDKVMQGYAYILTHPGVPCIVSVTP